MIMKYVLFKNIARSKRWKNLCEVIFSLEYVFFLVDKKSKQ